MNIKDLAKPFPNEAVHWRVQGQPFERNGTHSAMALAYIDARDVMDRLDEVCGAGGWKDSYTETASGRVICTLSIKIGDEWVSKSDGAGGTQVEAEKGGISDALKRAAVKWGIGRYLYRLDSPWVRCEVREKGGRKYWKAWAEDPWSKVKNVPYHQHDKAAKGPPDEDEAQRIIDRIESAESMAELGTIWKSESDALVKLKGTDELARVEAIKDDLKKQFEAKQAA
ncbi:Rad52/Rad22 family DNA repair protein [Thioclava sp. DLFJ4-1]|uniref:Rad52/Rad22 family DNA repair protein n=1 Tax=Thioclava sp. DLFJ4-1 TaxID=1915313 RepID=UPI000997B7EC|nr:Rad52/Rad22 family DNA repair protein [Thioclava sp. DLFJ4-1]OOY15100.1 hypothetical protein BMI85_16265 [Thioclava sp. DLFJ4-1]